MTPNVKANANQQKAIDWQDGPLIVLAGPGSGKTYVLTRRIARLISDTPDQRFRVLGLTFTTKAADEMRNRVVDMLGHPTQRVRLATFHSFAVDVLRLHGSYFGFQPDFRIISQDKERFELLTEAIERSDAQRLLPATANGKSIALVVDHLFREGYDGIDRPLDRLRTPKPWAQAVCREYLELLATRNYLDFGALLVYCLRLFRERPAVARHFRTVYPYVCVDEYQDTNAVQDMLLRAMYPDANANLFVVADDDQTIYQWNGADPGRLGDLRQHYGMETIQLPECYRCPPQVVRLANKLIGYSRTRSTKKAPLVSTSGSSNQNDVRALRPFEDADAEANWVAGDIRRRDLARSECTVLARSAKLLRLAEQALRDAELSPFIPHRKQEFESPLMVFVHSALRLCDRPSNFVHLAALCAAYEGLTGQVVTPEEVAAEATVQGDSLLQQFVAVSREDELSHAIRENLIGQSRYHKFVDYVLDLPRDAAESEREEISVWKDLDRTIQRNRRGVPMLSQFLQELDLRQKSPPAGPNDLQCLTIHLAKGKEFKHVYLMGLAQEQLPSYYAVRDGGAAIEEERRNCFVAITRAECTLTMTYARRYFGYPKEPSQFLAEMGYST